MNNQKHQMMRTAHLNDECIDPTGAALDKIEAAAKKALFKNIKATQNASGMFAGGGGGNGSGSATCQSH